MEIHSEVLTLAVILHNLNPATQPWDGDAFGFQEALSRKEYKATLALKQAEAIFDHYNA